MWSSEEAKWVMASGYANPLFGIERMIEEIVALHELSELDCVDEKLKIMASVLGAKVVDKDLGDEDGRLVHQGNTWQIWINTHVSPGRRRFTIAHECVHLVVLGAAPKIDELPESKSSQSPAELERICNHGAACILMPERRVREYLGQKQIKHETVRSLADEFSVSIECVCVRLAELVAGSFGFIIWKHEAGMRSTVIKIYLSQSFSPSIGLWIGKQVSATHPVSRAKRRGQLENETLRFRNRCNQIEEYPCVHWKYDNTRHQVLTILKPNT